LLFDDLCALPAYPFEIILNASQRADQLAYTNRGPQTRLLAGPQWSTVRREFQQARPLEAQRQGSIAITMGGSDPYGLTGQVTAVVLEHFPDLKVKVITGPAFRDNLALATLISQSDRGQILKDPQNLAGVLASTDLVITAAGGTIGELCALRQMAVCLVVSDNQAGALLGCPYPVIDVRDGLRNGELVAAVNQALNDASFQKQVRLSAHQLVDGLGCRRILNELAGYPCTTS
jgi:spore coat polysaccharide biosynthesis predicted glycosyltransferase SpsG